MVQRAEGICGEVAVIMEKYQISRTNNQINSNNQIQISKLFGYWDLVLGYYL